MTSGHVNRLIHALSLEFDINGFKLRPADFDANVVHSATGIPLLHTALCGTRSLLLVDQLISLGADVNSRDPDGNTALHVAPGSIRPREFFWLLLRRGADVRARNRRRETPLHAWVAHNPAPQVIAGLVRRGADVNARANFKVTPLHVATCGCSVKAGTVKALLDCGADVNALDSNGASPLRRASSLCWPPKPEVVLMLLRRGAWVVLDHVGTFYRPCDTRFEPEAILEVNRNLVKASFIENPEKGRKSADFRLELYSQKDEPQHKVLEAHRRRCGNEVLRMKGTTLGGGAVSLWNWVVRDTLAMPRGPYPRGVFRELYRILRTPRTKFVIYRDVLRRAVRKSSSQVWVKALAQRKFHAVSSATSKRVELNEDCIAALAGYLSKFELFYVVVAFDRVGAGNKRKFVNNELRGGPSHCASKKRKVKFSL